ncbi:MAG: dephospho-CoA kinase [Sphingobium sp.]|nr:MAG: dephospho-CoA kinase [Sphingobium sp.]
MEVWALTGSIGMGKSAVAGMLRREGVPVFDADAEVHRMQGPGGRLVEAIEMRFPGTTGPSGVDRQKLGAAVFNQPAELKALEAIVHPAVKIARTAFLRAHRSRRIVVLDIPLLFETRGERRMRGVIVVSAPAWKQRARVLARPGMTVAKFNRIKALQTPDMEKRRRADYVVDTGGTFDRTRMQVRRLVTCLRAKAGR